MSRSVNSIDNLAARSTDRAGSRKELQAGPVIDDHSRSHTPQYVCPNLTLNNVNHIGGIFDGLLYSPHTRHDGNIPPYVELARGSGTSSIPSTDSIDDTEQTLPGETTCHIPTCTFADPQPVESPASSPSNSDSATDQPQFRQDYPISPTGSWPQDDDLLNLLLQCLSALPQPSPDTSQAIPVLQPNEMSTASLLSPIHPEPQCYTDQLDVPTHLSAPMPSSSQAPAQSVMRSPLQQTLHAHRQHPYTAQQTESEVTSSSVLAHARTFSKTDCPTPSPSLSPIPPSIALSPMESVFRAKPS
ncbi:hypothetical protein PM082_018875 [Marasmius tenuissimus]|nr:hypothetical protein PM082_018875 [Marasmius tenuissimus]